jgi:hypothetical protein
MSGTLTKHPRHADLARLLDLLGSAHANAAQAAEETGRILDTAEELIRDWLGYRGDEIAERLWTDFLYEASEGPGWRNLPDMEEVVAYVDEGVPWD